MSRLTNSLLLLVSLRRNGYLRLCRCKYAR